MELFVAIVVGLVVYVTAWALGTGPMPAFLLLLLSLVVGVAVRALRPPAA